MRSCWVPIGILFLSALLIASLACGVLGQQGRGNDGKRFLTALSTEQRETVWDKMREMRSQGAAPEEIHVAVREMVQGYGIEPPEHLGEPHGPIGFGHGPGGFFAELTEDRRETVDGKIKEMRSQGAAPEEVHVAVQEMLQGYGIEPPEHLGEPHGPIGFGHGPGGFFAELTAEQRAALREKIKEMRSQGATGEEIRAARAELLKAYSTELPKRPKNSCGGTMSSEEMSTNLALQAQNYPNPFNAKTNIAYTLNVRGNVRVRIHDIAGRLVRSFEMGVQQPGSYSVYWDGTYANGVPVASGVYLYRVEAGMQAVTQHLTVLR